MELWETMLATFGGTAVLLVLLAYLAKTALKHWLDKDVDRFKADLKSEEVLSTERLKASLQRSSVEHQATFTNLLQERAEVIKNLHGRLVDLQRMAALATSILRYPSDPQPMVQLAEADRLRVELITYFAKNRIYLPEGACTKLDELLEAMRRKMISFSSFQQISEHAGAETLAQKSENWHETFLYFSKEVEAPIRDLESAFRDLLYPKPDQAASSA